MRLLAAVFALLLSIASASADVATPKVEIRTSDVELFFRIFDAASGTPSAAVLQRDYLDAGSDGIREFIPYRIISADELAKAISVSRPIYAKVPTCMSNLPDIRAHLAPVFVKLKEVLPDTVFPPVTLLIGRGTSGGMAGKSGVLLGMETICNLDALARNLDNQLIYLIVHEYIHVQQRRYVRDDEAPHSILPVVLIEGIAEFVCELVSGSVANVRLHAWIKGRESEIAEAFLKDKDGKDMSRWLYNGVGTPEKPGDLGYWVGYRIAKRYYEKASDKKEALRRLIRLDDPAAILAESGWSPATP